MEIWKKVLGLIKDTTYLNLIGYGSKYKLLL